MSIKLHLWIGNPQTASELSLLLAALKSVLPHTLEEVEVVFEKRLLSISSLSDGFTASDSEKAVIVDSAQQRGITHATAMFGLRSESVLPSQTIPSGLVYLGGFDAADEENVDFEESTSMSLYRAVIEGDGASVKLILNANPMSIYEKNEVGHTPLMASASTERPDIMRLLLNAGAPVDEVTPDNGYNALHWALHHPPVNQEAVLETVKALVAHGTDIDTLGFNGSTPLMHAAWFGAYLVVQFLLQNGADRHIKDSKGRTAKDMATQRGYSQIANVL